MALSQEDDTKPTLLGLPTELVHSVLSHLDAVDLIKVSRTCKAIQAIGSGDRLWEPIVNRNFREPIRSPRPCKSFRELYIAHHPNWFLLRHRIWFADSLPHGKLIIARFDPVTGSIKASQITAVRGRPVVSLWEKSTSVIVHHFDPEVGEDPYQPVVQLDINGSKTDDHHSIYPSGEGRPKPSIYANEIVMKTFDQPGLHSSFMLCRALPDEAITEQTQVWPPLTFPSQARARNESHDNFDSLGHRPSKLSEICEHIFRVRKWAQYTGRSPDRGIPQSMALGLTGSFFPATRVGGGLTIRMPEALNTFATLPLSSYIPTPEKPYQGIWCGDYSGHGCEFLLLTQPDESTARPLPEGLNWLRGWFQGGKRGSTSSASSASSYASAREDPDNPESNNNGEDEEDRVNYSVAAQAQIHHLGVLDGFVGPNTFNPPVVTIPDQTDDPSLTDFPNPPSGRLEAIKLTGDPNIPCGEYTFIAPEIGHPGFVRVADEQLFRGARVVRSAGHIAGTGFMEDQYTPTQLILLSHDVIAQFWEGFGHISYYKRVDIDALEDDMA